MSSALLTFWNLHRVSILMLILSALFYLAFGYDLQREDTVKLVSFKLIQFEKWNLRFIAVSGILLRCIFLIALPNLSQDFYRFIWDGKLLLEGFNPYTLSPDSWMGQGGPPFEGAAELHSGMGALSSRNFSNYPPVNQYFFAAAAYLGGKTLLGSVIAMRVMIILADLGILYFGRRLLRKINRAPNMIFWYYLNPLVILELTGNLHFEGVMLFFFVLAMYLILSGKWLPAVLPYGISIGIKLIPLLFLPLLFRLLGWKKSSVFYLGTALVLALSIYPLYFPEFPQHYAQTLKLWFSNFEFNAGLYNLAEKIALWQGAKPWEFIKDYGALIPGLTLLATVCVALHPAIRSQKFWFGGALLVLCTYYFTATVVHPWYVVFPLLLSLFTNFRFVIVWSATVILSYSAYGADAVEERPLWIFIEYFTVFGFLIYEIIRNRKYFLLFTKKKDTHTGN
ncbi:MAG: mannosyltransferase [Robiginitalea sp.]